MEKFKIDFEISVEINVLSYSTERPAPSCQNPSSPAYSDPGDPEEFEFSAFFVVLDKNASDGKILVEVPENMHDYIYAQAIEVWRDIVEEAKHESQCRDITDY